jgi:hypothetical protein
LGRKELSLPDFDPLERRLSRVDRRLGIWHLRADEQARKLDILVDLVPVDAEAPDLEPSI